MLKISFRTLQVADRPTTEQRNMGHFSTAAGTTPLMLAARSGSVAVIQQIVNVLGQLLVVDRLNQDGL